MSGSESSGMRKEVVHTHTLSISLPPPPYSIFLSLLFLYIYKYIYILIYIFLFSVVCPLGVTSPHLTFDITPPSSHFYFPSSHFSFSLSFYLILFALFSSPTNFRLAFFFCWSRDSTFLFCIFLLS